MTDARLPHTDRVPDLEAKPPKAGTLHVEFGGMKWGVACDEHSAEPVALWPDDSDHPDGMLVLRHPSGVVERVPHTTAKQIVEQAERIAAAAVAGEFLTGPVTPGVGPNDRVLAGTPVRDGDGRTFPTGPPPGHQPDCPACMAARDGALDHMERVQGEYRRAVRTHKREVQRLSEMGLLG